MMGYKRPRWPSARGYVSRVDAHRGATRRPKCTGRWNCAALRSHRWVISPSPKYVGIKEASRAGPQGRSGRSLPALGLATRSPRICRCRGARLLRGGPGGSLTTCTPQVSISSGSSREPHPEMLRPSIRSRGQKMTSGRRSGRRGDSRGPQEP